MKLINSSNNTTKDIDALGTICGRRCDRIELNQDDFTRLLSLSPLQLHNRISEIRMRVEQCTPKRDRSFRGDESGFNEKLIEFINNPETIAFDDYCKGGPVPRGEEYLEEMARKDRESENVGS